MNNETSPVMVIVGGAGGIGSAVARRLAARDCRIVLAGREPGRLQTVATETAAQAITCDAATVRP